MHCIVAIDTAFQLPDAINRYNYNSVTLGYTLIIYRNFYKNWTCDILMALSDIYIE